MFAEFGRVPVSPLAEARFLCLAWQNDAVWFPYLLLKSFSVSLMYVSEVLLSLREGCLVDN